MKILYTITRNATNRTVYATTEYMHFINFIVTHFPEKSYTYDRSINLIILRSNNYTSSSLVLDKDYILD